MDAIQSNHADFYDLPDDTRHDASANYPNQKMKLLGEVTITTDHLAYFDSGGDGNPILEGTDTQGI